MAFNFKNFSPGITLVPGTVTPTEAGDLQSSSSTGRLNYYNGSAASVSPVVTEDHSAQGSHRLKNKDLEDSTTAFVDSTDTTKQVIVAVDGTSSTNTTLSFSQTSNRIISFPDATTTVVGTDVSQTLTNKTLTSPVINGGTISSPTITVQDASFTVQDNVDNTKQLQLQLSGISAGTTRTLPAPDANTTIVGTDATQTLTNKTLTDSSTTFQDNADPTKQAQFQLSGITAGQTRTYTVPDANTTLVGTDTTQTLTNKTLVDSSTTFQDNADTTKQFQFQVSGVTTGTTRTYTVPDANTTIVGTDATQTLSNKTFSDNVTLAEVSTPSTPSSGFGRIYFKNDGFLYQLNDDGSETKVGAGTGGVNYILNPDAESNTTGWTTYADAAASTPVDGTGGSPNVTWTRNTSSPLRGTAMFTLTKDAANRQGEGVSYDFTIASADKAKPINISFEYAVSANAVAGSDSVTGDINVYIYDVTNSLVIQPAPFKMTGGTGNNWKYSGTFQTASNSTSYRLILHVAGTNSSAATYDFDSFIIGPQVLLYGSPISDWNTFTPTGSFTNTTHTGCWRRVGDSMEIMVDGVMTGTPGAATFSVNLPSGYTIDTAKLSSTSTKLLGLASALDSGTSAYAGQNVVYASTTSVNVQRTDASATWTQLVPFTWAVNDRFSLHFIVPISGWGSNVIMSQDTDTRVVTCGISSSSNNAFGNGVSDVKITYATTDFDTHGTYSSGTYTVPVAGFYRVSASFMLAAFSGGVNRALFLKLYKNGSHIKTIATDVEAETATNRHGGQGSVTIQCNAGDTLEIYSFGETGGITLNSSSTENWVIFERVTGPSSIAASEFIAAKATSVAGQSITSTSYQTLTHATESYDTHGAYSSGTFTAPIAGKYLLQGHVVFASSAAWGGGELAHLAAHVNGTIDTVMDSWQCQAAGTLDVRLGGSTIVQCNAGDAITIKVFQASGSTIALSTTAGDNWISFSKMGI